MTFLDKLERRFGQFAIPGLIQAVVVLNVLVFILGTFNPALISALALTPEGIANHEYWRLLTYILIPRTMSPIWIIFAVLWFWHIGGVLEAEMGAFRVNLFYFLGMFGTTIAALMFGARYSNDILNLSLIFAYAMYRGDQQMAFPPIPVRWLAWILAGFLAVQFFSNGWAMRAAILASLVNFFLFFGPAFVRNLRDQQAATRRREEYQGRQLPVDEPMHRCRVCGRTEREAPQLDFRFSSADGEEYCVEHLPKKS